MCNSHCLSVFDVRKNLYHRFSLCLSLKLKNVDFDGLFGNISSVIDLSERLSEALHETDSIGEEPVFTRRTYSISLEVVVLPTFHETTPFGIMSFVHYQRLDHKLSPDQVLLAEWDFEHTEKERKKSER